MVEKIRDRNHTVPLSPVQGSGTESELSELLRKNEAEGRKESGKGGNRNDGSRSVVSGYFEEALGGCAYYSTPLQACTPLCVQQVGKGCREKVVPGQWFRPGAPEL